MFQKIKSFLFENKSAKQTVAKNTVWLSISNFGGRILKAVIVIYAARILGTANWGVFSYAITLAGFFTLFMDPGMNNIIMREVPVADESRRQRLLSTALVMKLILVLIAALFIVLVAPFFSTLPGAKALLPIVALIIGFDTIREFFSSFIRAHEKMEWEAAIFLMTNLAIVAVGFAFLAASQTPLAFAWAYAIGTAVGAILAVTVVMRRYARNVFSHFSARLVMPIISSAWPFAITGALGLLLTNTDILIISWMQTATDVGIYSAAIRIIQLLYLVPMIFQFSTLPLLSRLVTNGDAVKFRAALERTISLVFLASIPIALGGAILGTQIVSIVFGGAYAPGGLAFKILALTMLVDFPAAILSNAIFAYHHQKSLIKTSAIGGITNVALDLLLIPRFGITGSAVATLVAQFASNWYLWHAMKKINDFKVLHKLGRAALAGIVMGVVSIALLAFGANVLLNIAFSGCVYIGMLLLLHEPILTDIRTVFAA